MEAVKMIYVSLAQRKAAYEYCLANAQTYKEWFLKMKYLLEDCKYAVCSDLINFYVSRVMGLRREQAIVNNEFQFELIISKFPEFVSFKPDNKNFGQYWFNSIDERIEVLRKCIELCSVH